MPLITGARAKAVADLGDVSRSALEADKTKVAEDARPHRDNVVTLASRR